MNPEEILADPNLPQLLRALADALETMNGGGQGAPQGNAPEPDLNAMAAAPQGGR